MTFADDPELYAEEDIDTAEPASGQDASDAEIGGCTLYDDTPSDATSVIENWSCEGPIEQAVILWPDVSATQTPVALSWSAPTGEFAVLDGMDLNGDGIVDLCVLDTTGSGTADTWLQDTTCRPSDSSGAYFADTMYVDSTGDGLADCACQDPTGSGEYGDPVQLAPAPEAPSDVQAAPAVPEAVQPAPAAVPAPVEPAPAAQTITAPVDSPDPLIQAYSMTNDPAVQAQIARIMDIRTRTTAAWL